MTFDMKKLAALDFTDRDSYRAWHAEWKAAYLETEQAIRASRRARKQVLTRPLNREQMTAAVQKTKIANPEYNPILASQAWKFRADAHALLSIRWESKAKSAKQRQARLVA